MALVTAKQLAEILGISPTAVSLALNGKAGVSEKTRLAVTDLANKMGYKSPHHPVESTKTATKTLCFMIFAGQISKHSTFSSFVLESVEKNAALEGYHVLIRHLSPNHILDATNLDLLNHIDGLLVLGTDISEVNCPQILKFFSLAGDMPKIILDNSLLAGELDCICTDNYGGARQAAAHLIEHGCQTIGYLRSKHRVSTFDDRERGIRDILQSSGLAPTVPINLDICYERAFHDMLDWLDTDPVLPQGFFADNDVLAAAAISAFQSRHIKVPEDVSIIGFDDEPIAQMTSPHLTSVKTFMTDMGTAATNMIFRRLKVQGLGGQFHASLQTLVSTQLQERGSVAPPAARW